MAAAEIFSSRRGIGCLVMEPASLKVNRRARRVKTDRIDVENILHTLIAWCRGEHHVCWVSGGPSVVEEGAGRGGSMIQSSYFKMKKELWIINF